MRSWACSTPRPTSTSALPMTPSPTRLSMVCASNLNRCWIALHRLRILHLNVQWRVITCVSLYRCNVFQSGCSGTKQLQGQAAHAADRQEGHATRWHEPHLLPAGASVGVRCEPAQPSLPHQTLISTVLFLRLFV